MKGRSWQSLDKPKVAREAPDEFAILCFQVLGGPTGKRLMKALHTRYINAVLPGEPSDRALLQSNAKRQLVREIEDALARGLVASKTDKKP